MKTSNDESTEEKIKEAARKLFTQNGFAATKTRDIAKEAGINSALLNYYFRSKKKLYELIMQENLQQLMQEVILVANDKNTSLEEKMEMIVDNYTRMLLEKPNIPLFVINEIQKDPDVLLVKIGVEKKLFQSHFFQQIIEAAGSGQTGAVNPLHFIANFIGLIIFPFLTRPVLQRLGKVNDDEYKAFLEERKKLIPLWIKSMAGV